MNKIKNPKNYYVCNKYFDQSNFIMPEVNGYIDLSSYQAFTKSIDLSKYKALLFDLDGTLIDNIEVYDKAWDYVIELESPQGVSRELLQSLAGKSADAMIQAIKNEYDLKMSTEEMRNRNDKYLEENLLKSAKLLPLAHMLNQFPKDLKLGVGTGSNFINTINMLEHFNIAKYFSHIVTSDQVVCEKPSPLTWLLLAEKFNVYPEECLVFEDSENGMRGALMSGMDVIDVKKNEHII